MVLLFGGAVLSQLKLQVIQGDAVEAQAIKSRRFTTTLPDPAKRGAILAADGRALALDEDAYELNIQFEKAPRSDGFYMKLAEATGIPASEFLEFATSGVKSRSWLQPVNRAQKEQVDKLKKFWKVDGISLTKVERRSYPLAEAASGIVGMVREDKPILGLEKSQDSVLSGTDGKRKGMTDRRGLFLPMRISSESKPHVDGHSIGLTIDTELQRAASEAIREAVERNKATNGVAIVIEPRTGDLLAMANWPAFRPYGADGLPAPIKPGQDLNPAISAQLEAGSTFKILTLAKGLDDGVVHPGDQIYCSGVFSPTPRTRIHCAMHHGGNAHGQTDLTKAIAKSCNVSAAQWAEKIGYDHFVSYMRQLGLLRRTKLGLPYELHGNFNYEEPNRPLQLATLGFGQSVSCTPVALAGAFSMLANGGVRMEPRLIRQVDGKDVAPEPGEPILKPETTERMLGYMESVIESDMGTGKELRIPGYRLGGKTGTAQRLGGGRDGYVSNFVGFVPSRAPRAVILVMVDHPTNGEYYGGSVAGPAFKTIAESVIRRYSIPATEPLR